MEKAKSLSHEHTTIDLVFMLILIEFLVILDIRQIWLQSKQTSDSSLKCD
jgi:hypothetical protein